ncbi:MAG TPA: NUDIX hydrolase, partial [Burkholderiaceae bacterium]|nr:NUDIX hydrolase [Burkholderiaceae bacterium]
EIELSPELAEYRLYRPEALRCWRAGTGYALADWLTARGIAPQFIDWPARPADPATTPTAT